MSKIVSKFILTIILLFGLTACSLGTKLSENDVDRYYHSLGNTYADFILYFYKTKDYTNYSNKVAATLKEFRDLEEQYRNSTVPFKFRKKFKDLKKFNIEAIRAFDQLEKGYPDSKSFNKITQLMNNIAIDHYNGNYPEKYNEFYNHFKKQFEEENDPFEDSSDNFYSDNENYDDYVDDFDNDENYDEYNDDDLDELSFDL